MQETTSNSLELVKTTINLELTKAGLNYQKLLQDAENIVFSKEDLDQDYSSLKKLRDTRKKIDDIRKIRKKPYKDAADREDAAAKSLIDPIDDVLDRKTKEYAAVASEIKRERDMVQQEENRKAGIQLAMNNFILHKSSEIASATTDEQLVRIESLINLECTRKNTYEEYLDEFKAACLPLRELLKTQKEQIRAIKKLDSEIDAAFASDDDGKAIELQGRKEEISAHIENIKTQVQEQAISSSVYIPVQVAPAAPKARMKRWTTEIVDVERAFSKCRDLLDISLNAKRIGEKLNEVKAELIKEGKTDIVIDGIRYYQEEKY